MEIPRNELITSVSNLKGAIVRNGRDEKLGEIEDLVLDFRSGQMVYIILLVNSGLINLENKYFIIPWEEFHYDLSQEPERAIILDMDKKDLEISFGYENGRHGNGPHGNGRHGNGRILNPLKTKNTRSGINVSKTNPYISSSFTLS
jgi:sporulation protein YlmC with PRC-barrel domain